LNEWSDVTVKAINNVFINGFHRYITPFIQTMFSSMAFTVTSLHSFKQCIHQWLSPLHHSIHSNNVFINGFHRIHCLNEWSDVTVKAIDEYIVWMNGVM
jgi:hypothetical protein